MGGKDRHWSTKPPEQAFSFKQSRCRLGNRIESDGKGSCRGVCREKHGCGKVVKEEVDNVDG